MSDGAQIPLSRGKALEAARLRAQKVSYIGIAKQLGFSAAREALKAMEQLTDATRLTTITSDMLAAQIAELEAELGGDS